MLHLLALLLAVVLTGCGTLRNTAEEAIALDGATTAAGLLLGAAHESNPIISSVPAGLASVAIRIGSVELANRKPEPDRTETLAAINAISWGIVANNVLAILGAVHPVSLIAGGIFGLVVWDATGPARARAHETAMKGPTP